MPSYRDDDDSSVLIIHLLVYTDDIIVITLVVTPQYTIVSSRVINFITYADELPFRPHYFAYY